MSHDELTNLHLVIFHALTSKTWTEWDDNEVKLQSPYCTCQIKRSKLKPWRLILYIAFIGFSYKEVSSLL